MKRLVKWTILLHAAFSFYACARVFYESFPSCPRMFFMRANAMTMELYEPRRLR